MVMGIYSVWVVAIIILWILTYIFNELAKLIDDNKRSKNILNSFYCIPSGLMILFFPYNIYTLVINLHSLINFISILYIIFSVCIILTILLDSIDIFEAVFLISFVIGILALAFHLLFTVVIIGGMSGIEINSQKHSEYSYTIDILNMQQVPYTNVSGGRYYIRSVPSGSYYYEAKTKNGNTTTKIIDGYNHYVEKDINNKYIDNPHIDVYKVVKTFYDVYGRKKSIIINENYTICIPEDTIYYESKSQ